MTTIPGINTINTDNSNNNGDKSNKGNDNINNNDDKVGEMENDKILPGKSRLVTRFSKQIKIGRPKKRSTIIHSPRKLTNEQRNFIIRKLIKKNEFEATQLSKVTDELYSSLMKRLATQNTIQTLAKQRTIDNHSLQKQMSNLQDELDEEKHRRKEQALIELENFNNSNEIITKSSTLPIPNTNTRIASFGKKKHASARNIWNSELPTIHSVPIDAQLEDESENGNENGNDQDSNSEHMHGVNDDDEVKEGKDMKDIKDTNNIYVGSKFKYNMENENINEGVNYNNNIEENNIENSTEMQINGATAVSLATKGNKLGLIDVYAMEKQESIQIFGESSQNLNGSTSIINNNTSMFNPTTTTTSAVRDQSIIGICFTLSLSQLQRKIFVTLLGIVMMVCGILVLGLFFNFVDDIYFNHCIKPNDKLIENNPELLYFDQACTKKVVNIFDNDNPCNCRGLRLHTIDYDYSNNRMNYSHLDAIFSKWTMLEAVYIDNYGYHTQLPSSSTSVDLCYNFTSSILKNFYHLRILNVDYLDVAMIDDSINHNLKNLEVLRMYWNTAESVYIPWQALGNIEKMQALYFHTIYHEISDIDDSICNLKQLSFLQFAALLLLNSFPIDCFDNWHNLKYFHLLWLPSTQYINPKLWVLSNIRTIIIQYTEINDTSFNNDYFKENGFSSSLDSVYFTGDGICSNTSLLSILGTSTNSLNEDYYWMKTFIDQFNPCLDPCNGTNFFQCRPFIFGDGKCDSECDNEECFWDSGDCNQLCDCDKELWFNDKCDIECNTTDCDYDFGHCVTSSNDTCFTSNFVNSYSWNDDYNYNYSNSSDNLTLSCYIQWKNDAWCDLMCLNEECGYDSNQCSECTGLCYDWGKLLMNIVAGYDENGSPDIITENEVCGPWTGIKSILVARGVDIYENCTDLFTAGDINGNGLMGLYELLVLSADFSGIGASIYPQKKLEQIDCSACLTNSTLYYV